MKKALTKPAPQETRKAGEQLELGRWLGRREAFSLMAGRCSAAEIESLRRIRDERLYLSVSNTWDTFCSTQLGASRRNVERNIRLLEEFGPAYFQVAQMAHIGPREYRAIAAHVDAEGVRVDGAVVALLPENSVQIGEAVGKLLKRAGGNSVVPGPGAERSEATAPKSLPFSQVLKRCDVAARILEESDDSPDYDERLELASILLRMRQAAAARGVAIMGR